LDKNPPSPFPLPQGGRVSHWNPLPQGERIPACPTCGRQEVGLGGFEM